MQLVIVWPLWLSMLPDSTSIYEPAASEKCLLLCLWWCLQHGYTVPPYQKQVPPQQIRMESSVNCCSLGKPFGSTNILLKKKFCLGKRLCRHVAICLLGTEAPISCRSFCLAIQPLHFSIHAVCHWAAAEPSVPYLVQYPNVS